MHMAFVSCNTKPYDGSKDVYIMWFVAHGILLMVSDPWPVAFGKLFMSHIIYIHM